MKPHTVIARNCLVQSACQASMSIQMVGQHQLAFWCRDPLTGSTLEGRLS